jgi:hypothetical protein
MVLGPKGKVSPFFDDGVSVERVELERLGAQGTPALGVAR